MGSRTHLFLALSGTAFGELNLALRIAWELHDRGEGAVFLAPSSGAVLFKDSPFGFLPVDDVLPTIDRAVPKVMREKRCDTIVLVDVASVFLTLDTVWGVDPAFLDRLEAPVIALDVWNLRETDLRWDFGTDAHAISPRALELTRRLVPVPFARPTRDGGAYNALPAGAPLPDRERADLRDELGIAGEDKLVLLLSSKWQTPELQMWKHHRRLARFVPLLALEALASLGPRLRAVHVGPQPFEGAAALGERYRCLPQVNPERFRALLGAADLLLSFNASATTTISAVASGLPVVLAINSHMGRTAEEVLAKLPGPAPESVSRWLPQVVPLHRFRVWPLGLYDLLSPVLADNPYLTAMRTVELLDWDSLVGACHDLLFDPASRAAALEGQAAYRAQIQTLPSGGDLFLSYL